MTTWVQELAGWAAELDAADLPERVTELCRAQRRSVLGAMAASCGDPAAERVLAGLGEASEGGVPVLGAGRTGDLETALYAACSLSIALDFDDYLCFGHTGHSAVLVPLLAAVETGAGAREQMAAQAAANEIEARLGGACVIGPLNGQMWSFIHAAGAAVAAGKLHGLGAERLAHALAIALYQAPHPTVTGFMAPDTKLLTAAEPTIVGLRAARLAAAGVTGPLDALDHPHGFFEAFAHAPMRPLLGGLGRGWATRTLCIKPYPGCAYVDTPLDALVELGPPDPERIAGVRVEASVLTCQMDRLSSGYAEGIPSPVTMTFSLSWTLAVAARAGRLTPDELAEPWLRDRGEALHRLVDGVELEHGWAQTLEAAESFASVLAPRGALAEVPVRTLLRGLSAARRQHGSLRPGPSGWAALAGTLWARGGLRLGNREPWHPEALERFRMTFPARVEVRTRDGDRLRAEAAVPRGGAGHPEVGPDAASRDKLAAWAPRRWGRKGAEELIRAVEADRDDLPGLLARLDAEADAGGADCAARSLADATRA